ncbi:ABC-2 type transport system ATP-binding protein [Devosia lucknowensis]|uniref:ABC-2 type transport system ATP-binding protein n=1 Tax=Devosia lucknowensis TaxID=1096929 RepID=A0A1Y6FK83_9HYPH|nr:ABC transporter ATP-binding protein [Devosia lucknowensis]SMQ72853.1 ABC-2 type transport system ATP-binding protein [Devosia lucknowensis]
MSPVLQINNLTVRYGNTVAIDGLTLALQGDGIHGLLGRNGSGKSSLLSVIAGLRKASGGSVLLDGQPIFENEAATTRICLIREGGDTVEDSETVATALRYASDMRPFWDGACAERLLGTFKLDARSRIGSLSRGQRSALGCILGLAARAPVTLFDEVYLGLDAPSRYAFYEALLADYMDHPRLIVLSTHLIEEVARLFSDVIIIHDGKLLLREDAETIQGRGLSLIGPEDAVARATSGLTVLATKSLGPTRSVAVYGQAEEVERRARDEGLEVGALPLQDLFVHLTAEGMQK